MLDQLATAIEGLDLAVDAGELTEALRLRDRFEAKVTLALAAFDDAELWDEDGSVSAAAWLRIHAGIVHGDAARLVRTARRLRILPAIAAAWVQGELTGGQIAAVTAIITNRTAKLFADKEHLVARGLAGLDGTETTMYLRSWQARAEAFLDRDDPTPDDEPSSELFLSPTLDGRGRLDANLAPDDHDVVRTNPGSTVARPVSRIWCSSAAATTTSSTAPAGTSSSSPPAPSRSRNPTAPYERVTHRFDVDRSSDHLEPRRARG